MEFAKEGVPLHDLRRRADKAIVGFLPVRTILLQIPDTKKQPKPRLCVEGRDFRSCVYLPSPPLPLAATDAAGGTTPKASAAAASPSSSAVSHHPTSSPAPAPDL